MGSVSGIPKPPPPKHGRLYKYVSADASLVRSLFGDMLIRFTPPYQFNDPFDMLPSAEPMSEADLRDALEIVSRRQFGRWRQTVSFEAFKDDFFEQSKNSPGLKGKAFQRRALERFRANHEDRGVLCLTENRHSLLMWAHYARSHEGLLLEFRYNRMFTTQHKPEHLWIKVVYTKTRPKWNTGASGMKEDLSKRLAPYRTKSVEWQYEAEWRIFATLSECDKQVTTDTGKVIYLSRFNPESLRRVVLGYRMTPSEQDTVFKAIRSNPKLAHVLIQHAQIDLDSFRFDYLNGLHPVDQKQKPAAG